MSILDHKALKSEARVREMHLEGNSLFIAGYHFNLFLYLLRKKNSHPFKIYIFLIEADLCFVFPLPTHLQWCDLALWPSLRLSIFAIL